VHEELSSVLLEAMQADFPIVASRTGGIPDATIDEVNGLFVPSGYTNALAWALDRILTEPGLVRRLGSAARERARDYETL
jgi:glycosyltransferase involved in cell wall biosynthesis